VHRNQRLRRSPVAARIRPEDRSTAALHHARDRPFSTTKKELSEAEIEDRLDHYGIPTGLPLVVQVSGFDKWKDPQESSKRSGFRSLDGKS
jgi:hypothetical protein